MPTKYRPLVDHIAAQHAEAVMRSFLEIEALVGVPLPETMRIDDQRWQRAEHAFVWRLGNLGWYARLDRRNRCVHFTRTEE